MLCITLDDGMLTVVDFSRDCRLYLQEVMNSYDANSRLAYILGLLICALMIALGIVLIYQAFHFERFVFGRSQRSYDLLKKDMQDKSVVSAGNLIVTDQFMLLFSKSYF